MGELPIHLFGDRSLLEHHHHVIGLLRQRRNVQIDRTVAGIARRAEIDLVFVDRGAGQAHLLDKREQGTAERHQVLENVTPQERQRDLEKSLSGDVGVRHLAVGCNDDHGVRQRIEHRIGGRDCQERFGRIHAASLNAAPLPPSASNASARRRCTTAGSVAVST